MFWIVLSFLITSPSRRPSSPEHIKVVLTKEDGPLGLNVELVESGSPGLYIVSIEPDSAAEREGSLRLGDQVVEVNGVHLTNIPLVRLVSKVKWFNFSTLSLTIKWVPFFISMLRQECMVGLYFIEVDNVFVKGHIICFVEMIIYVPTV